MLRDFAASLFPLATLLLIPVSMVAQILPAGTGVEVRFLMATGSRISHPGDPVKAVVIAPVFADGRLTIGQGAMISGAVEKVERVGLGLKHLTSEIEYRFDSVQEPDAAAVPLHARVMAVETAKERVNSQGLISGIHPTANVSSGVAFYALPLLCTQPGVAAAMLGIKTIIARSPDPEIYFPAGTEMLLELTSAAKIPRSSVSQHALAPLTAAETAEAQQLLAKLPEQRTDRGHNHPSDLVNILFLGSRGAIDRAFEAAGWSGAQERSLKSIYRMYHCMVQRMGYSMAPMGNLRLNGVTADAEYQKSLDTFSKRHHLRLWKQGTQDAWLSAATEDTGYTVRGMHLTHATDSLIDNERAKVLNDLTLTGCVAGAALIDREVAAFTDQGETSIQTDSKIAVIRMNACENPRTTRMEFANSGQRGRALQALVAMRNDLIRTNFVSLAYNTSGVLREHERALTTESMFASSNTSRRKIGARESSIPPRWVRSSVLDGTKATEDGKNSLAAAAALSSD
ncbi:MAG: LssY C-terminal domain-containing protein [Acidobacteriaceae bacterium]|nr:LssY C-terminal domain-containing protein [Acidobacteriaceae bacterium]